MMRALALFRQAVQALLRSPFRAGLAVGAMAIGVAAVLVLFALSGGAEQDFQASVERFGRNLITVNAKRVERTARPGKAVIAETLTPADACALAVLPGVGTAVPVKDRLFRLLAPDRRTLGMVVGTMPELFEVKNHRLAEGRFIDAIDVEDAALVAVIGGQLVTDLFHDESPLGQVVRVGGVGLRIVGVLARKGIGPDGDNEDIQVIVPLTAMMRRILNVDWLDRVYLQAVSAEAAETVVAEAEALLRRRHALVEDAEPDFALASQDRILRARQAATDEIRAVVEPIAWLTLGLGCVGTLAVMTLSVRERWREIGLRRAVGAETGDILVQFVSEAGMIGALAAGVGVGLGASVIAIAGPLTGWPLVFDTGVAAWPCALSVGLGLSAGVWPAWRASRLDPIQALRS